VTDRITKVQLQAHYDAMWDQAIGAIAGGDIDCDTRIAIRPDPRRGITVIARPGPALRARFDALLDLLCGAEPEQYRYPAADMHMTVLSLCTATENAGPQLARADEYRAAAHAALDGFEAFDIDFDGIAVSAGAVLARGMTRGPALETLRERLRSELRLRGLDASLDRRYRLITAHSTLLRFAAPLQDSRRFAALLEHLRDEPLGSMRVDALELVMNDWYMSAGSLQPLARITSGG
jgi:2'-5' RNA ligase